MEPGIDALNYFLRAFTVQSLIGISDLRASAHTLLWGLGAIELILASLWWAHSGGEAIGKLVKKLLFLTVFVGIVDNYTDILALISRSFIQVGFEAAGGNSDIIFTPSGIVLRGLTVVKPLTDYLVDASGYRLGKIFMFSLALLVTLGAYVMLAVQVLITRVEFAMMAALGFLFVPLAVFKPTAFLSEKVFGAMVALGVKLMVLSFIIAIGYPIMTLLTLPVNPLATHLVYAMVGSIGLAVLALHAPGVAAGLLVGSPSLTAGAVASGAALAAGAAASPYLSYKGASLITGAASAGAAPVASTVADVARVGASKLGIKAEQLGFGNTALKQGLHGGGSASGFPKIETPPPSQGSSDGAKGAGQETASGGSLGVKNFQSFRDKANERFSAQKRAPEKDASAEPKESSEPTKGDDKESASSSKNDSSAPAWAEQYFNKDKASQGGGGGQQSRLSKVVNAYQVGSSVLERTAHPSGGVVVPIRPHED